MNNQLKKMAINVKRLPTILVVAAASAAPSQAFSAEYEYTVDACGFHAVKWHKYPEDLMKELEKEFNSRPGKPGWCPGFTHDMNWSTGKFKATQISSDGDYNFSFQLTNHAYLFTSPPPTCTLLPPQVLEWQVCASLRKRTYIDRYFVAPPPSCKTEKTVGNPISPMTGAKQYRKSLAGIGGLPIELRYESLGKLLGPNAFKPPAIDQSGAWFLSAQRQLSITQSGALKSVVTSRGDGRFASFLLQNGSYVNHSDRPIEIKETAEGYTLFDRAENSIEVYDLSGRLREQHQSNGRKLVFTDQEPSGGAQTSAIADSFGRSLSIKNEAIVDGPTRLAAIEAPGEQEIQFLYDSDNRLSSIRWPDGSGINFTYSTETDWALTSVTDEAGEAIGHYAYDSAGRAVETQGALGINRFRVNYDIPPLWRVELNCSGDVCYRDHYLELPMVTQIERPDGQIVTLDFVSAGTFPRLRSQSQPAGSGCSASTSQQDFDANGNLSWREDFSGNKSCFTNDLTRNLEVVRVEGLAKGSACDATASGATLPTGSRKTSTQWHPDWHLATRTAEPGRVVTRVYNGQPDPFAGGAVASCAPASAKLPDGKPIVVLCKEVEQASTDVDGSKGFAAALDSTPARVQSWTYNAFGQVLTHDGARTDVADITVYEYYPSTDANWTMGDLKQVTNPAGQVTRFTKYNRAGKLLQSVDANGIVTDSTYDARQRLKSVSTAGATTAYDYFPTGLLKQVTEPDGSWVGYEYDAAHRLVAVKDGRGNRIDYTLDNSGKRIAEKVSDPQGALKRNAQRTFDALGRLEQLTGRE